MQRSPLPLSVFLLLGSIAIAPGRDAQPPTNVLRYEGKLYDSYSVQSISPEGVMIRHSKGTLIIPLEKVPPPIATPHKKEILSAFERRQREQQEKTRADQELRAKNEKYPGYEVFHAKIIQVVPRGVLVDRMKQHQVFTAPVTSSMQRIGGGGGAYGGGVSYEMVPSGDIAFIEGDFAGKYDGQIFRVEGCPTGTHSYVSVLGAQKTVQKWALVP